MLTSAMLRRLLLALVALALIGVLAAKAPRSPPCFHSMRASPMSLSTPFNEPAARAVVSSPLFDACRVRRRPIVSSFGRQAGTKRRKMRRIAIGFSLVRDVSHSTGPAPIFARSSLMHSAKLACAAASHFFLVSARRNSRASALKKPSSIPTWPE